VSQAAALYWEFVHDARGNYCVGTAGKGALDLMRSTWQMMPKGEKRDELAAKMAKAESALQASSAALAKSFGYKLCRCTFPPQIMLWKQAEKTNVCEVCSSKDPVPEEPTPILSLSGPNRYFT
jgi:hypothetical protein